MSDAGKLGVPFFARKFAAGDQTFTRIGDGSLGGKASGLWNVHNRVLSAIEASAFPEIAISIPTLTVLCTDLFDSFMASNDLYEIALSDQRNDRIAHAFQKATLPASHLGDLRALIAQVQSPLAVRSSSLLEDDLAHPFAGVYATKMIPNNQPDVDTRFQRLTQAIKFVYASTFFAQAKYYIRSVGRNWTDEKMAVVIQEVVGQRAGDRYYPDLSGVARSYNYYPSGHAQPKDGVISLALGLGKQIVDGGLCWTYSPAYPQAPPPYNNIGYLLKNSQTKFWAVNMGRLPLPDPIRETEYLLRLGLKEAEYDGALTHLVSTYDPRSDRLRPSLYKDFPHVLNFAPILCTETIPLNKLLKELLALAEQAVGAPVEVEFAVNLPRKSGPSAQFGFLQMRPMMVSDQEVEIADTEFQAADVLLASENVLGNGLREDIRDVVFVKPDVFEPKFTSVIAKELEQLNQSIVDDGKSYLLIGFGRWGSSDPWLGIPVEWGQISAARVIVESSLPDMNPDLSQGSHFFHNLISFRVLYLSAKHHGRFRIDWAWLESQKLVRETKYAKHVKTAAPLIVTVDGRLGRGIIKHA